MTLHRQLRRLVRARLRPVGAALAAFAVLALSILSASPDAHAWIHASASDSDSRRASDHGHEHGHGRGGHEHDPGPLGADHVCVVTLAQQGFCDTTPALSGASAPTRIVDCDFVAERSATWSTPDHWLQPAQGPPARR